jgi:hypothetical protein
VTTIRVPKLIDIDTMLEHSFRDFHAKGLDYLCLHRSPERTVKAYFFEGDTVRAPELVAAHDHRYNFLSEVVCGGVANRLFMPVLNEGTGGIPFERFDYRTPLNGGDGFTWKELAWLSIKSTRLYGARDTYSLRATEIHTIKIARPDTILLIEQGPDVRPHGEPTSTFRLAGRKEPPSLAGLYRRMDADHALMRHAQLMQAIERAREAA